MTIYDELRKKCRRDIRTSYLERTFRKRGPAKNGAYAQPFNPFERVLMKRKTAHRRARLRLVGDR